MQLNSQPPHDSVSLNATDAAATPIASIPDPERLVDLTWRVLDDDASKEEIEALEQMLSESDTAREEYLHTVRLHTDLMTVFGGKPGASLPSESDLA